MTGQVSPIVERLAARVRQLSGARAERCLERIVELIQHYQPRLPRRSGRLWDERDVVLITYGDQVQEPNHCPLQALHRFLTDAGLKDLISTVHILPFFPFSSDDGFSVIDYRAVDPNLGDWADIHRLGGDFELMFDLVLNHVSQHSCWFQKYLAGEEPHVRYFLEADPGADLSAVTRPRSLPLLTRFETSRGARHLWTTFSEDQIDLNFAHPDVLVEMLDILLLYIEQGARIVRLDAVAYLWKEPGTACIHQPQTHLIVKILRDLIEAAAPGVLLLTETNVPHAENVSYFGDGDEAHMVYQFSLPPLLLDAFLNQDAGPLVRWLAALEPAPAGSTYFNFTASHDGVGVRPLEGLVSAERRKWLVEALQKRGGLVSTKRNADGSDTPYELNISYLNALGEPEGLTSEAHVRRFLASQAIMLALRGIPAVYFHSLIGTPNDIDAVATSRQPRRINRRKLQRSQLAGMLSRAGSLERRIFDGYRNLLAARIAQPAFHPDASQETVAVEPPWLLAFRRTSLDQQQQILVLANLSGRKQEIEISQPQQRRFTRELLAGCSLKDELTIRLGPYEVAWLEATT